MTFIRSPIVVRRSRQVLARLVLVALVGLVLTACGSSSTASSASAGGSSATAKQASSRLKFTDCMRQHGVNISDQAGGGGGGPPAGIPQSTLQAAGTACRKYAGGAFGNFSPAQRSQFQAAFVKYTACLRAHGVNIPDPTFGAGGAANQGGGFRQSLQNAQASPSFKAANSQCSSVLPAQLRNRAGGAGPGG